VIGARAGLELPHAATTAAIMPASTRRITAKLPRLRGI